ncbi:hypothetical protein GCL60_01005 [Silvanigrella paludirubra]|uniref:Transporter substrate-binding domain-containing protein n=1 Tax=Silvanigrella paludirubra TaxID=2499159 RepID=A0A6N6VV92_9BACT|nr:hypothetical protein [Silvanigrella paludirubra]KAB8040525.1 hypothetical protein GCL60_01005 [Silvanigrella paludirubra]
MFFKILLYLVIFLSYTKVYSNKLVLHICANDLRLEDSSKSNTNVSIDVLKIAINNFKQKVDVDFKFEFMPWNRCFSMLQKGEMDAALNASYRTDRALFLDYPPDSGAKEKKPCSSLYKVACSGYVIITLKSNRFEYKGDPKQLPRPVRVSRGYSIVNELETIFQNDLEVSKSDTINIQKLIRDKEGSVITHFAYLLDLKKFQKISNEIKIHKKFYVQKSYYVPFSKKSKLSDKDKLLFWNEIKNVFNNKELISGLISKYYSQ